MCLLLSVSALAFRGDGLSILSRFLAGLKAHAIPGLRFKQQQPSGLRRPLLSFVAADPPASF